MELKIEAQAIWDVLNKENKVALAVKFIQIEESTVLMTKRNALEGD